MNSNTAVKILIADDEPLLRFHLQRALEELWPNAEIVASASNGQEVLDLFPAVQPDVLFMDIRMPELDGMETSLQLYQQGQLKHCSLVFLTAYDQFALDAFARGAVDYLLKPVDEKRLCACIERIEQRHRQGQVAGLGDRQLQALIDTLHRPQRYLQWINAQKGDSGIVVAVSQVQAFQAEDKYTTVITHAGEALIRMTIKELEQQLDPDQFWRIHRGTIVQVSQIVEVKKHLTGRLTVALAGSNRLFVVSRAYNQRFKVM